MVAQAAMAPPTGSACADAGKRALPDNRMVEHTLRVGRRTDSRFRAWVESQDGKQLADAWRDIVRAGMAALKIPEPKEAEQ